MQTTNHKNGIGIRILLLALVLAVLQAAGGTAHAISDYMAAFNNRYGTTANDIGVCIVCHNSPSGGSRNPYGTAFAGNGHDFATIEPLDSDGDGFSNIAEITARTFPGNAASVPSSTAPTITTASPLPAGTVGVSYSQTLAATGGTPPLIWSVTVGTPPAGLTLSGAGVLSGTPTTAGTSNFTVQVSGGGTDTMAFSLTINAVADVTPPTVISTIPDNNATGVAVGSNVTATFNEAIDPASVTVSSFFLSDGVDNVVGTISVNGAVVAFDPTAALADNTTYTATLTTGITDLAGNALAANYVWSFTTGVAGAPPPTVSDDGGGGCAIARSGGGIGEIAGAYGFLVLTALGIALRRRSKGRQE